MSTTSKDLVGSMVALVTPMERDGSIQFNQWRDLLDWHIRAGTRAVVVAGTTGESALLKGAEVDALLESAVERCRDSDTRVIAGTGAISPETVIDNNRRAHALGADAALVVTPYYIRVTQAALVTHYRRIADASQMPLIMYNVPSRTAVDLDSASSAQLSRHDNIIGIKEAKRDMQRIAQLRSECQSGFAILSGDDDSFLEAMRHGAFGVISVAANARPHSIAEICQVMALGDHTLAEEKDRALRDLYRLLSSEPNPGPVKWLLHKAGLIDDGIRAPLSWMKSSETHWKNELDNTTDEYNRN